MLMEQYSADALRFLLLQSPLLNGEDFSLQDKEVADVQRKLAMAWNMYDFFTMYADVDGWEWNGKLDDPTATLTNPLDLWIVSRAHQLTQHVTKHMNDYDLPTAVSEFLPFLDDASNWYVRRSRRRFWKSGDSADKHDAYRTLHYVLVRFAMTIAPFTPFMAEELFLKLTGGNLGSSVHLLDWPAAQPVDEELLQDMAELRQLINQGLSQRAAAKIKVRQPLASARLVPSREYGASYAAAFADIAKDELNVKQLILAPKQGQDDSTASISLDTNLTDELKREGMAREVIRFVQNARKQAGLNIDDRIHLTLVTNDPELEQAIAEHSELIQAETLAESFGGMIEGAYTEQVHVDGRELTLHIARQ